MAYIEVEGSITTATTAGQYNATTYTVPASRLLYVTRFVIWVAAAPTGAFGLGLSGAANNANLIGVQYSNALSSYNSGPVKRLVGAGGTLNVFSDGWPNGTGVGYLFEGVLL